MNDLQKFLKNVSHIDKMWIYRVLSQKRIVMSDVLMNDINILLYEKISQDSTIKWKIISDNPDIKWDDQEFKWRIDLYDIRPFSPPDLRYTNITCAITLANPGYGWNRPLMSLFYSDFKREYNECLPYIQIGKLKKIRQKVKRLGFKNWYKLYLLTKTEAFFKWYCAEGNIGNKVDKARISQGSWCSKSTNSL